MRCLIQRVAEASVTADGELLGRIGPGMLVFVGIHREDTPDKTQWLVNKLVNLRLFEDDQGKMNRSLLDTKGEMLVVSQFTVYGNCQNGRRPNFGDTAKGPLAEEIYNKFVSELKRELPQVQTGRFGAAMQVALVNDGPVTFIIDSK